MEILAVMHPNDIAMAGRRISIRKVLLMTVGAFWCLLVLSSVRAAAARRLQIQGVVRSETGEPIADCLVMGNDLPTWVTTDKDGRYSMDVFESVPGFNQSLEVISFRAKGYMPWTKVVRRDSITLNATLATVRTTDRGLPSCPPSRPDKRQVGYPLHSGDPNILWFGLTGFPSQSATIEDTGLGQRPQPVAPAGRRAA